MMKTRENDPSSDRPEKTKARGRVSLQRIVHAFHAHAAVAAAFNLAIGCANILTGPPWWGFWPHLASVVLLLVHYFAWKAARIDDHWVSARTSEIQYRSYDRGHIEQIRRDPASKRTQNN